MSNCAYCGKKLRAKRANRGDKHCSMRCRTAALRTAHAPPPVQGAAWIPLAKNKFALVDKADVATVRTFRWRVSAFGYAVAHQRHNDANLYMHRLILTNVKEIDHINRNKLDNRRQNLRSVTRTLNNFNSRRRRDNTSGHRGVSYFTRTQTWRARIWSKDKEVSLGYYKTKRDAVRTYECALEQVVMEA